MSQGVASAGSKEHGPSRLAAGKRVAAAATVLTLLLAASKGLVGYLWHSPALTADAVHSGADVLAIFASWLGLKLAERPATRRFPFGMYRAETLASLAVSVVILVAGIHLLYESASRLAGGGEPAHRSMSVIGVALVSSILSFGIYLWEKRVGTELNSQSLLANADESRADIITSFGVFIGTGATYLRVPVVELVVTTALSLLIIWLGVKHGRTAVYALLDASLHPDLECQAADIASTVPGVLNVEQLRLRQAGPFCFGIAHIQLRKSVDIARAHEVAHRVAREVIDAIPQIETLTVHLEPFRPVEQTVMVPADADGMDAEVSSHFGRARLFVFATLAPDGVKNVTAVENAIRTMPARAGLSVIKETLKSRKVDAVLTREIGEIAFHALRDHFVEVYTAPEGSVRQALAQFAGQSLQPLTEPTHASEAAGRPATENQKDC